MLLHGIDTNKVNRLHILVGVTSLVDGDTKVLGFFPKFAYELGKTVADAVFSSSNHGSVTQSSVVCALIHTRPHRNLVERVESAHFLKMLSDETCCGWRVGTKCKFFYRRICLACVSAHQLDQRLYSSGDCGRAGLCSIIIWYSPIGQAPAYLTDLCRPSLSVRSTRHLRSAEQGLLHVPFARTSTMQSRAFSVVGPLVWNGLP